MLTSLTVMSSVPRVFDIENVDPMETLIIESISGLSSVDVTLFTGAYSEDGGYYQGRRANPRNVVLNFKMNPDYENNVAVSDIRESLYRMFYEPTTTTDEVAIQLVDDRKPLRYVVGFTEKMEADQFAATTKAQVSLICVDPYIRSWDLTSETNAGGWASVPFTYDGTADTGLVLDLKVMTGTPTVTVELNGQKMVLTKPSGSFNINDIIHINTVTGERAITTNAIDQMSLLTSASVWLSLREPANTLKAYGTVVGDAKAVVTYYAFRSAWRGI